MNYRIEIVPKAIKDLQDIPKADARMLAKRIEALSNDLAGDVKKLTNFTPEYRLRVGNWRVLFEIEGERIVIYRILNRKEVYR